MRKTNRKNFTFTILLLAAFILWTAAVRFIDVQAIGPRGSAVGFAAFNGFFHELTGVHMLLYTITDWMGIVPICVVLGFAALGLVQLIKRKSLLRVDHDILALGGFYVIVFAAYALFEVLVINYRPVLIAGHLEASYPSSTTMLVLCVMPTAMLQLKKRIKTGRFLTVMNCLLIVFSAFMVVGRLVSGVHWFSDIIGGVLLSGVLVMLYYSVTASMGADAK